MVTAESTTQSDAPVVGITLGTGYDYEPEISFDFGQQIGGPSAGLVFALAIYDKITEGPLLAGRTSRAPGTITPGGQVGPIGGIQQKIAGAEKAGATDFLVPAGNCADLAGLRHRPDLIKVNTLRDAIAALQALNTPAARPAAALLMGELRTRPTRWSPHCSSWNATSARTGGTSRLVCSPWC